MNQNWVIEFASGTSEIVQCDVVGVAKDGSLICFIQPVGSPNPMAIQGYAPGQWKKFHRSTLRTN